MKQNKDKGSFPAAAQVANLSFSLGMKSYSSYEH